MDNNMTAIVSSIMIVFGFLNGIVIATLLERNSAGRLQSMLIKTVERKFELEQMLRETEKLLDNERSEKEEILLKMNRNTEQNVDDFEVMSTASTQTFGNNTD